MTNIAPTADAPAASLVGSLAVFSLADILSLLADSGQAGELQVVSNHFDGRLWLDHGNFTGFTVGTTQTITKAVFELGLLVDGWFYFTAGEVSPTTAEPQPVSEVLTTVRPQLAEWHELLSKVPLDATVQLSPTPPSSQVQIKPEQWKVLTTVGSGGMSVMEVVDRLDTDQVVTLSLLRDMADSGLLVIVRRDEPQRASADSPWTEAADADAPLPPPPGWAPVQGATEGDATSMPPPISADPWSPVAEHETVATDGQPAG